MTSFIYSVNLQKRDLVCHISEDLFKTVTYFLNSPNVYSMLEQTDEFVHQCTHCANIHCHAPSGRQVEELEVPSQHRRWKAISTDTACESRNDSCSYARARPETLQASVPGEKRSARRDATLIQSLFWESLGSYRPRGYN